MPQKIAIKKQNNSSNKNGFQQILIKNILVFRDFAKFFHFFNDFLKKIIEFPILIFKNLFLLCLLPNLYEKGLNTEKL